MSPPPKAFDPDVLITSLLPSRSEAMRMTRSRKGPQVLLSLARQNMSRLG